LNIDLFIEVFKGFSLVKYADLKRPSKFNAYWYTGAHVYLNELNLICGEGTCLGNLKHEHYIRVDGGWQ
jgi:hypothetical protein